MAKAKLLKRIMELNWNFQGGGECKPNTLPWWGGGYGYVLEPHTYIIIIIIISLLIIIYGCCLQAVLDLPRKCPDGTCDGCR